jgi:hypothetical protein
VREQTDVDTPLVRRPGELVFSPGAFRVPDALCDIMDETPATVVDEHWTINAVRIE